MRVAVVGAGIIGVTTAHELAAEGHEVLVFERRGSVAAEASFAHAGVIAPGLVAPWPGPGGPWRWLPGLPASLAGLQLAPSALGQLPWLWRALLARRAQVLAPNRSAMQRLAVLSRQRLLELTQALDLDFEQADGVLVLLRSERALRAHRPVLKRLAELEVAFELLDAAKAREIEPSLNPATPLRAAVRLPQDAVGNGRQFAHRLKAEAVRLGASFRFDTPVRAIRPGARPEVVIDADRVEKVDAVVLCTGAAAAELLAPAGIRLPLVPVWGLSVTAPVNHVDGQLPNAPRAAVIDERHQVTISRLGQRVRVAGGHRIGGSAEALPMRHLRGLYRVLDEWFPGSAVMREAQHWAGARPMLPDGAPLLGASGLPGVWLNLGHGGHGWALACGSARVLAAGLAGRDAGLDLSRLGVSRLGFSKSA